MNAPRRGARRGAKAIAKASAKAIAKARAKASAKARAKAIAKARAKARAKGYNMGYNMGVFQTHPYVVVVDPMFWATSGYIGRHYNGASSCGLHAAGRSMSPVWRSVQKTQAFPSVSHFSPLLTPPASSCRTTAPG